MSIEIKLHEPPVTFGMLPVGTLFKHNLATGNVTAFKHRERNGYNAVTGDGVLLWLADTVSVEVVSLPPGASLAKPKPKARMVRIDSLKDKTCFRHREVTYRIYGVSGCSVHAVLIGGSMNHSFAHDTLVQPCRVEVHVCPEVEA